MYLLVPATDNPADGSLLAVVTGALIQAHWLIAAYIALIGHCFMYQWYFSEITRRQFASSGHSRIDYVLQILLYMAIILCTCWYMPGITLPTATQLAVVLAHRLLVAHITVCMCVDVCAYVYIYRYMYVYICVCVHIYSKHFGACWYLPGITLQKAVG